MIRVLAGLVAVLTTLDAASAQTGSSTERVRVRAGEHAGFSRLAFDLPSLAAWDVALEGRQLVVTFPNESFDFDVRQIFPERRVTRVTSARPQPTAAGSALRLALSCDCEADAYRFGETMLVVDLRERQADPDDRRDAPGTPTSAEAPGLDLVEARARERGGRETTPPSSANRPPRSDETAAEFPEVDGSSPTAEPISVSEARRRLLRQLTRAADQGLIAFRDPEMAEAVAPSSREETAVPVPAADEASPADASIPPEASPPSPSTPADAVQLEARTAFDPLPWNDPARLARLEAERAARCGGDAWLDTAAWIGGEDMSTEDMFERIAAIRGSVVSELDGPIRSQAVRLAQLYLALGLGAEARQALEAFGAQSERVEWLRAAAAVLDGATAEATTTLEPHRTCGGRIGLWRLAAGLSPAQRVLDDDGWRGTVLEAFEAAPLGLRRMIAPSVVETLLGIDAIDLADAIALRLERAPGPHGDAWRLAAARLALSRGEYARAEDALAAVVDGGGPAADEALLMSVEHDLAEGRPISPERLERLGAAAFANRGSELGLDLLVTEIRARAGKGELRALFDAAAGRLPLHQGADDAVAEALRRALETVSADEVGPAAYAEAILSNRGALDDVPAWDPARRRIAAELTGIGLPNVASEILRPALDRDASASRLAAAEIEAAMWRDAAALGRLDGLGGRDADRLRAEVHQLAGRHDDAFDAAATSLERGRLADLAFRAGRWSDAMEADLDAMRAALAEAMTEGFAETLRLPPAESSNGAEIDPAGPPSLASVREAIARSARIRDLVQEYLEDG